MAWARSKRVLNGPSAVAIACGTGISGGLASAIAGRISPRIVRARRSTASCARSAASTCGIGVVGGDDVDPIDHRLPDVGVQIERDGDRQIRAGDLAHAAHDLGLGVGEAFGHHRPVQGEHDAVGRQRGGDALGRARQRGSRTSARSGVPVETPSAKKVGARSMPCSRQASMTPPSEWLRPAKASSSSPRAMMSRVSSVVGSAEKVCVSCMMPPVIRRMGSSRLLT